MGIKYCQHRHSLAYDAKIVGKLTGFLWSGGGILVFIKLPTLGCLMLGDYVYVCLHAQMHTPHMAVWCICGRKSYWWIIALTFVADPITALCLTLPLPSSQPLIPLVLQPPLFCPIPPQHTHTHWKTCSNSSCLANPTCELLGWNVRRQSTYLTWHACQSEVVPCWLWL